jgi:hypothetical protein
MQWYFHIQSNFATASLNRLFTLDMRTRSVLRPTIIEKYFELVYI